MLLGVGAALLAAAPLPVGDEEGDVVVDGDAAAPDGDEDTVAVGVPLADG
jgi:hypothetical protein